MKRFKSTLIIPFAAALLVAALTGCPTPGDYFDRKGVDTYVKLAAGAKAQRPFEHPAELSEETMARFLGSIQYVRRSALSRSDHPEALYALFTQDEIDYLAPPLAQALAAVGPDQWADFSINAFRGQQFVGGFHQTDGVIFIKAGKINVALRNIAVRTALDQPLNAFDPTRAYRALTRLVPRDGQERIQDNWIAVDPKSIPAPDPAVQPESPSMNVSTSQNNQPPEARTVEERLNELEDLYDKGLITKEEYERRRKEILDEI